MKKDTSCIKNHDPRKIALVTRDKSQMTRNWMTLELKCALRIVAMLGSLASPVDVSCFLQNSLKNVYKTRSPKMNLHLILCLLFFLALGD